MENTVRGAGDDGPLRRLPHLTSFGFVEKTRENTPDMAPFIIAGASSLTVAVLLGTLPRGLPVACSKLSTVTVGYDWAGAMIRVAGMKTLVGDSIGLHTTSMHIRHTVDASSNLV